MSRVFLSLVIWAFAFGLTLWNLSVGGILSAPFEFAPNVLLILPYFLWTLWVAQRARHLGLTSTAIKLTWGLSLLGFIMFAGSLISVLFMLETSNGMFLMYASLMLFLLYLAAAIAATISLKHIEAATGQKGWHPFLTFVAFYFLVIGMFFLRGRITGLRRDTTFD